MIGLSFRREVFFRIGFSLLVLSSTLSLSAQNRTKTSKTAESEFNLRLRGGDVRIVIRNETENPDWNRYAFEKTKGLIDSYESYLGFPFHQATLPIYRSLPDSEKNKIRLVLKEAVFLNGTRVGGYNNVSGDLGKDIGIFMEAGLVPQGYPALLLHELGHYYFTEPTWLSEGIVSFLPYLLAKKGTLRLDAEELLSVREEWSLEEKPPKKDPPLSQDFHLTDASLGPWYYSKCVRTQFILYKELGPEGYKNFLKQVAASSSLNSQSVLQLLGNIQRKDWARILQGWVFAGPYAVYPANSFTKPQDIEKL
ncbi:hypothetical protein CH371_02325 [Leptospira wolffii]|uniref:Peptidase MA family protein n=1 Tax=Leptospira wolffii TaxID=409998 RepID=A0A2M9ZEU1_9LEPT|nr:hypothetical protein [Leptospira wolffii]PJZ66948.1 hypothetical protein CH371_02325 [Leptospira wolffii]